MNAAQSPELHDKLACWFFASTVVMLAATAVAKGIGGFSDARVLSHPDPLFGLLTMRQSVFLAAVLEIAVVLLVWHAPNVLRKAVLLLWIASVFLVYRIGLWWVGFEGSCRCLGNIGDVFGISTETADWIAKGILASSRCITRVRRSTGYCARSWRPVCRRGSSGKWW